MLHETLNTQGKRGHLFVVSAPSGAGKSTLCAAAIDRYPNLVYSISSTTRHPRIGETEGEHYFFLSTEAFERKINENRWAEWAKVHGHYYGTSASFLNRHLDDGRNVLLDIDVQGTRQILRRYPDSITIFIKPPSLEVLKKRLLKRGTDSRQTIEKRMAAAKSEIGQSDIYRHIIINDVLPDAVTRFNGIFNKYIGPTG